MSESPDNVLTLESLVPPFHPLVPNPTQEEVARAISTDAGRAAYLDFLRRRKKRLEDAHEDSGDPFHHGFELTHWKEADDELRACGKGQYNAGGKRATKTERAAWRLVMALYHLQGAVCWALQGTGKTATAEQHKRVWRYLPKEVKAMNGRSKHVGWAKVDYNIDRGFGNNVLVMPSKSELHFLTYNMDYKAFQGWELGAPDTEHNRAVMKKMPWLLNIGAWADEDMPLPWLETVQVRCATRDAMWLWTYSTMDGITAAIKSLRGVKPQIIRTARAELLPENQVLVPGCPPGHMPICERAEGGISIFYFWTEFNPFPPNYKNVKALVAGKPRIKIQRDAYGFDEDTKGRAYPKFGRANIITEEELPFEGSNYKLTDPAGNRMWATIWVRVTDEDVPRYFIFADWPDQPRFGDWAEPGGTGDPDGVPGPAQDGQGYGWLEYKQAWRDVERVEIPETLKRLAADSKEPAPEVLEQALGAIKDRQRRAIVQANWNAEEPGELFIAIEDNFIDSRAGNDEKHQKSGSLTAIEALDEPHPDGAGGIVPGVRFRPASGVGIETGRTAVNALLAWDMDKPLCRVVNEPKLYVVDTCKQVIGMFNEYTGTGGEKGAWKDFDDLVRYMATSGLGYVPKGRTRSRRQGSY